MGDDSGKNSTETSAIFAGTGSDVRVKLKAKSVQKDGQKNRFDELKKREKDIEIEDMSVLDNEQVEEDGEESALSNAKLEKMRELARALSLKIGKGETNSQNNGSSAAQGYKVSKSKEKDKKKKKKRRDASKSQFLNLTYYTYILNWTNL